MLITPISYVTTQARVGPASRPNGMYAQDISRATLLVNHTRGMSEILYICI